MDFDSLSQPKEQSAEPAPARQPLNSLRLIIFQPDQAFANILRQPKRTDLLIPLLLILALAVIAALLATQATSRTATTGSALTTRTTQTSTQQGRTNTNGGNRQGQVQPGAGFPAGPGGEPPAGAIAVPGGQIPGGATIQNPQTASAAQNASPWVAAGLPAASFLITWLLLGVLTNLFSLAFGGHSGTGTALVIAAWASIPLAARNLMQILYYLATGAAIQAPGLSGFAPTPNKDSWLILLQQVLSRIDVYFIWQIALLAVGVSVWGGLSKKKSIPAAILVVVLVLLLQSLISLGLELLGNVNINTNMLLRLR
jgi:hypothetical protein